MKNYEEQYLDLMHRVLFEGEKRDDRTGVGTYSLFGEQIKYKANDPFPILVSKNVYWRGVVEELLWFLRGETNIRSLQENNVHIWDKWADENGDLGPIYGKQWRDWDGHDQIATVIDQIINNPDSRRIVVNAWNVAELGDMALHPCHMMFQFSVRQDGTNRGGLDMHIYQRSADLFLGVPFNMASYALLLNLVAVRTYLNPGTITHSFGDVHIYQNHVEQALEQLRRRKAAMNILNRRPPRVEMPLLMSKKLHTTDLRDLVCGYDDPRTTPNPVGDFFLMDYKPLGTIKAPVAV